MPKFFTRGFHRRITPESSSHEIKFVFTSGHCHSLALALSKLTGWPIYGMYERGNESAGPFHVIVKSPKDYVDIEGPGVLARWPGWIVKPITRFHIRREVVKYNRGRLGFVPSNTRGALPFAKELLKKHFKMAV